VTHPVLYNPERAMLGSVGGMCKGNTGATMAAILNDERFDLTDALILMTGCAGGPSDKTELGEIVVCDELIDFDMGHHFSPDDVELGEEVFKMFDDFAHMNYFVPGKRFAPAVEKVLHNFDQAASGFKLSTGSSITSDNFWHGKTMLRRVNLVTATVQKYHNSRLHSPFKVSQCEDTAIAQILKLSGLLDNLVVTRSIVNFVAPIDASSAHANVANPDDFFDVAHQNCFEIGKNLTSECNALYSR
jgi:purine nucleoside permease